MADNILKGIIQIEATGLGNVAAAGKSLSQLEKQFQAFGGLKPFANLNKEFKNFVANANTVKPSADRVTNSLTNLSRVAQDAPYGFIGIANNLNPLLESFQRLRAESDSNKTAFKSLLAGLTGPAGLGLALGVVSSLAVTFGGKLFGLGNSFSTADAAAARFENSLNKLKSSIEDLRDRLDFESDLKKLALDFQNFTTGGKSVASKIIDSSSNIQLINELTKNINELTKKRDDIVKFRIEAEKTIQSITKSSSDLAKAVAATGSFNLPESIVNSLDANDRLIVEEYKKTNDTLEGLKKQRTQALASGIKNAIGIGADVFKEANDKINEKLNKNPITIKIRKAYLDLTEMDFLGFKTRKSLDLSDPGLVIKPRIKLDLSDSVQEALDRLKAKIKLNEDLGKFFQDTLFGGFTDGIEAIFEGVGNILSGKDFGAGIVSVIGNLLQTLGKALIKYGAIKAGLDKILGPGGIAIPGGVAIALGAAAIAAGAAFKNLTGKRAFGGGVSAGGSYLVGERGPELFTPSVPGSITANGRMGALMAGSNGGGMVEFFISGSNLRGVLAAANRRGGRLE